MCMSGCAKHLSQIENASGTFTFYDGGTGWSGMEHTRYLSEFPRVCWTAHAYGANFAWMDGHVERIDSEMQDDFDWFAKRKLNSIAWWLW